MSVRGPQRTEPVTTEPRVSATTGSTGSSKAFSRVVRSSRISVAAASARVALASPSKTASMRWPETASTVPWRVATAAEMRRRSRAKRATFSSGS